MPRLWNTSFNGLIQFEETQINTLPQQKDITSSNKRLGKLAEDLFSFWTKQQARYNIVFENLQIIDRKQTIGELDVCLYNSVLNKHIHLELITKFYLYNPAFDCNSIDAWIGPNRNDSLKNKIEKLSNKQLPLLFNPVTSKKLTEFNLAVDTIEQQVCFKAWLFVPHDFKQQLTQFNPKCIAGYYMTLAELHLLVTDSKKYFCPNKQDWLRFPESQIEWSSFSAVAPQIDLFMEAKQAIMVWIKNKNHYERVIITPYKEF